MEKEGNTLESNMNQEVAVYHHGDYDVVLDKEARIDPVVLARTIDSDFATSPDYRGRYSERRGFSYKGPDGKPLYFIKQRWWITKKEEEAAHELGHKVQREDKETFGSLLQEMQLSSKITELIDSEACQNIVTANGFDSIEFVPPIGGVVRKGTTERYTVYPYHPTNDHHNNYMQSFPLLMRYTNTISELKDFFIKNGISPFDLGGGLQFDNDNTAKLVLIDIEGFRRIKDGEDVYTTDDRRLPEWENVSEGQ